MNTLQRCVIALAVVLGLTLFGASTATAQYAVTAFSPQMVHTYSVPYMYYPPFYQPVSPTYYAQPYPQPFPQPYYYTYAYPRPYYYRPVFGGRRFVTGMYVWPR